MTYHERMLVCPHKQPSLQIFTMDIVIPPIQVLCLSWHVLWTVFIIWNLRGIINKPRKTIYRL